MRRIHKTLPCRRRGGTKVHVEFGAHAQSSNRATPASGLMLLGTGSGGTLPALGSVPSTYQIETNGELLYRLCVELVERKLVDEQLWLASGKIPIVFARNAIDKMIERLCGDIFKDNLEYACEVRDHLGDGYHRGESVGTGKLVAQFDLQTAGFLVIGAAMQALDNEDPCLGAAFYLVLGRALRRWMPIYDHFAAKWYNERLHEMMEEDDPESRENYEFPPVEEATPPSVKIVDQWDTRSARRLMRQHLKGPRGAWIEKLFSIVRLSRLRSDAVRLEQEYDDVPVPSVLIVFRENDAIHACWDYEGEHYNEASNEPACTVAFRPDHPEEFDAALRTMHIFLTLNIELAGLVNLLNDWEKEHAREPRDRAEPALRAA